MSIRLGTVNIGKAYLGNTQIQKVYQGTNLIYTAGVLVNPLIGDNATANCESFGDFAQCSASVIFNTNGTLIGAASISAGTGTIDTFSRTWYSGFINSADYEIRATIVLSSGSGGTLTGDAVNTWLNMGTARSWGSTSSALTGGFADASAGLVRHYTFEIRRASDQVIVASTSDKYIVSTLATSYADGGGEPF